MGEHDETATRRETKVERISDREVVVRRTFDAPVRIVFEAWSRPEIFRTWWAPQSMGMMILSCEMDVRTGGNYRLVLKYGDYEPMAFFGRYLEVVPLSRMVWTNEEGGEGGPITTVTFEAMGESTLVVVSELHASKEALDAAGTGAAEGLVLSLQQLETLLSHR